MQAGILDGMALEHAILVSLRERPASGLDLARRFDRSIGFFWSATHQQIYRVLARMEADGWVSSAAVEQQGRPDKKVYEVTDLGADELADWLASPLPAEKFRSELAVRLRVVGQDLLRGPLGNLVVRRQVACLACEGEGEIEYPCPIQPGRYIWQECEACQGTGVKHG